MKSEKSMKDIVHKMFSFNPLELLWNAIWFGLFTLLSYLTLAGIRVNMMENYFQYIVFLFLIVFCAREAARYLIKLHGLFIIPGIISWLYFVFLLFGIKTPLLTITIIIFSVLLVVSGVLFCIKKIGSSLTGHMERKYGTPKFKR